MQGQKVDSSLPVDYAISAKDSNQNGSEFDFEWQGCQRRAGARSTHTITILHAEQRAVGGALDVPVVDIHELVG